VEKTFQTAAGTFSHSGIFLPYVEEESVIQKFPHDEFFSLGYLAPAAKLALKVSVSWDVGDMCGSLVV